MNINEQQNKPKPNMPRFNLTWFYLIVMCVGFPLLLSGRDEVEREDNHLL